MGYQPRQKTRKRRSSRIPWMLDLGPVHLSARVHNRRPRWHAAYATAVFALRTAYLAGTTFVAIDALSWGRFGVVWFVAVQALAAFTAVRMRL